MEYELFRQFWYPQSFPSSHKPCSGFKAWLGREEFQPSSSTGNGRFTLAVRNVDLLKASLIYDVSSLATNSLETIHSIRSLASFPKVGAWQIIKVYYAAFFAAHAILRLWGRPVSFLESGHVNSIKNLFVLYGVNNNYKFPSGTYLSVFDAKRSEMKFVSKDNSHVSVWGAFHGLISELSLNVLSAKGSSKDLSYISNELGALNALLTKNGQYNLGEWLSKYRNEVNYQSPDDLWFPQKGNALTARDLFKSSVIWRDNKLVASEINYKNTAVERYFDTCLFIVQFMNNILVDFDEIYSDFGPEIKGRFSRFVSTENRAYEV